MIGNNKLIIGISGKAGAGKDTLANHLIKIGMIGGKVSIADSIKETCSELFNLPIQFFYDRKEEQTNIKITKNIIHLFKDLSNKENEYMTYRDVLQYFGTNIIRKINEDFWIDLTISKILNKNNNIYAIPDVRFENEINAIKKHNGIIIRLTRNPFNMSHISEIALDNFKNFDIIYDNKNESEKETMTNLTKILKNEMFNLPT